MRQRRVLEEVSNEIPLNKMKYKELFFPFLFLSFSARIALLHATNLFISYQFIFLENNLFD